MFDTYQELIKLYLDHFLLKRESKSRNDTLEMEMVYSEIGLTMVQIFTDTWIGQFKKISESSHFSNQCLVNFTLLHEHILNSNLLKEKYQIFEIPESSERTPYYGNFNSMVLTKELVYIQPLLYHFLMISLTEWPLVCSIPLHLVLID